MGPASDPDAGPVSPSPIAGDGIAFGKFSLQSTEVRQVFLWSVGNSSSQYRDARVKSKCYENDPLIVFDFGTSADSGRGIDSLMVPNGASRGDAGRRSPRRSPGGGWGRPRRRARPGPPFLRRRMRHRGRMDAAMLAAHPAASTARVGSIPRIATAAGSWIAPRAARPATERSKTARQMSTTPATAVASAVGMPPNRGTVAVTEAATTSAPTHHRHRAKRAAHRSATTRPQ